ncbi:NB-ARC domain containing protein [Trema orientale]|uniref:NB-ARC domain containing protein n=1 Tax=Trema orientale TaxID=63057 RepID=A0A2P5C7H7_TREOI|nr:NB-ARC domain containing protein [Trema orientale]
MREVADQIEDVVDEYLYRLTERRCRERGFASSLRKARDFVRFLKPRHDIASEIRDIKQSLREIKERGVSYGLRHFEQGSSGTATNVDASRVDPRLGSLFIEEDELVGIDSISEEVITSLVEGPSTRSVISFVGEGGIGKTTLAKKVFNDEEVRQKFECFAWITVSQSYNMEKVLKSTTKQIYQAKEEPDGTIEQLIELLRNYMEEKRYVVVFDDIWKVDFWEVIKYALPSKKARIIITTRNTSVANDVKETPSDHVIVLKPWSMELAWELFWRKTFCFEFEGCCPKELEQLSRKIVSKCQGLPLAIAAVAGLLSKKEKTQLEWQRVLDNLNYEFEKNIPNFHEFQKFIL